MQNPIIMISMKTLMIQGFVEGRNFLKLTLKLTFKLSLKLFKSKMKKIEEFRSTKRGFLWIIKNGLHLEG